MIKAFGAPINEADGKALKEKPDRLAAFDPDAVRQGRRVAAFVSAAGPGVADVVRGG